MTSPASSLSPTRDTHTSNSNNNNTGETTSNSNPLLEAIDANDVERVRALIDNRQSTHHYTLDISLPFHEQQQDRASSENAASVVVSKKSFSPTAASSSSPSSSSPASVAAPSSSFVSYSTPLGRAARHGFIDIVRLLLDHGAYIHAVSEGATALHKACMFSSKWSTRSRRNSMSSRSPQKQQQHSSQTITSESDGGSGGIANMSFFDPEAAAAAAAAAASSSNRGAVDIVAVVRLLLEKGANPFQKDAFGKLPIHIICENYMMDSHVSVEVLELLLASQTGDDDEQKKQAMMMISAECRDGHIPLYYACQRPCLVGAARFLISHGSPVNVPDDAVVGGSSCCSSPSASSSPTTSIGSSSSTTTRRKCHGHRPIHTACATGNFELVKLIVESAAASDAVAHVVTAQDNEGYTPLHCVGGPSATDIAKYLVAHGAKLDVRTHRDMEHPLHTACFTGKIDLLRYFVEDLKVDVTKIVDKYQQTLLHSASSVHGFVDVGRYLVGKSCGIDVDAVDENGATALHLACEWGLFDVVVFLVQEAGANIEIKKKTYSAETPRQLAESRGKEEIARFLRMEEAKLEFRRKKLNEFHADYNRRRQGIVLEEESSWKAIWMKVTEKNRKQQQHDLLLKRKQHEEEELLKRKKKVEEESAKRRREQEERKRKEEEEKKKREEQRQQQLLQKQAAAAAAAAKRKPPLTSAAATKKAPAATSSSAVTKKRAGGGVDSSSVATAAAPSSSNSGADAATCETPVKLQADEKEEEEEVQTILAAMENAPSTSPAKDDDDEAEVETTTTTQKVVDSSSSVVSSSSASNRTSGSSGSMMMVKLIGLFAVAAGGAVLVRRYGGFASSNQS